MVKTILTTISFLLFIGSLTAQSQSREELEKQRQDLKKEIDQIERLRNENKNKTKGTYVDWKLVNDKVNLQDRMIENINRDINMLDNNIYSIQRDINKYNHLLDTLKQEYAKSMVYAYKNRSNYDFLNFIFSAGSFNDAIKRIAYIKSYRDYRNMQGENITRTQELRRKRLDEMTGVKHKKTVVLDVKSEEMDKLEKQKVEKDKILADLKKQGKQLNNQYAAKTKQLKKVSSMIATAIETARREAIAKAAAASAAERRRLDEANKLANLNSKTATTPIIKTPNARTKTVKTTPASVLLNSGNEELNASFEHNRGGLPWPVDKGYILMHFGMNDLQSGTKIDNPGLTISADIGSPVKAVFAGTVIRVKAIEEMQVVILQHGKYFSTYSNIKDVSVQQGQEVKTGQVLGRVMANDDGIGAIDFIMSNEKSNFDPARWLHSR